VSLAGRHDQRQGRPRAHRLRALLAAAAGIVALGAGAAAAQKDSPGPGQPAGGKQEAAHAGGGQPPPTADQQPPASPGVSGQPPRVDAGAWIVIDALDGDVVAAKGADRPLPIASATKLMTAYLTLENLKPNQTVTAAAYQPIASAEILLGLDPGEKIKVRDLLYGLLLPSANDAAHTLALAVADSVPAFVEQMNQEAQSLGLANTSFSNPIGLDAPDNYSSARDLATLTDLLLANRLFARIVDTPSASLRSGDAQRRVDTRNNLLTQYPFIAGVKTGHTIKAGYVLVGAGTRDSTTLISVVLGAPSEAARDAETLELLNYGFSLYRPSTPVERGAELADPKLDYRDERLPLIAARTVRVSAREGEPVETRVEAPDEVSEAVEEGEELGRVVVTVNGKAAASSPLVAAESVEAASFVDKVGSVVPLFLIPVGAFVIVVGLLLALRGRRPDREQPSPPRNPNRSNERRNRASRERTPEERRRMHQERMRRRRQRAEGEGGA
jgi:serine-type D-Ala-D-Ala carboxypeptidase (penicillin-binding protein 5/6)